MGAYIWIFLELSSNFLGAELSSCDAHLVYSCIFGFADFEQVSTVLHFVSAAVFFPVVLYGGIVLGFVDSFDTVRLASLANIAVPVWFYIDLHCCRIYRDRQAVGHLSRCIH